MQLEEKNLSIKGKILGLGSGSWLSPKAIKQEDYEFSNNVTRPGSSILTEIDLETGKFIQAQVPVDSGHDIVEIPGYGYICIGQNYYSKKTSSISLVDFNLKLIATLDLPNTFRASGHGLFDSRSGYFLLAMVDRKDLQSSGSLLVIDPNGLKIIDQIFNIGVGPHDLKISGDNEQIIICNYGNLIHFQDGFHLFDSEESGLTFLNRSNLEKLSHIEAPQKAAVSHCCVDGDRLWIISLQGLKLCRDGANELFKDQEFYLSPFDLQDGILYSPLPVSCIEEGKLVKKIHNEPSQQRRALSIALNKKTKVLGATHIISDSVVFYDSIRNETQTVSGFELGLQGVRGIAEIENTSLFAISAGSIGLVIFDVISFRTIARYPIPFHFNTHISYII